MNFRPSNETKESVNVGIEEEENDNSREQIPREAYYSLIGGWLSVFCGFG